jgi:hypothetical protein
LSIVLRFQSRSLEPFDIFGAKRRDRILARHGFPFTASTTATLRYFGPTYRVAPAIQLSFQDTSHTKCKNFIMTSEAPASRSRTSCRPLISLTEAEITDCYWVVTMEVVQLVRCGFELLNNCEVRCGIEVGYEPPRMRTCRSGLQTKGTLSPDHDQEVTPPSDRLQESLSISRAVLLNVLSETPTRTMQLVACELEVRQHRSIALNIDTPQTQEI